MQQFKFNHNDYVTVTLTKEGAEHLNKKREDFYDQYPKLKRIYCDVQEGETYKVPFWGLVADFHEMLTLGSISPFELGEIIIEKA